MMEDIAYILAIHAVIILVQFSLAKLVPRMKKSLIGVYLILLPVGFLFFADLPPWMTAAMVIMGVYLVFLGVHGVLSRAAPTGPEGAAHVGRFGLAPRKEP